MHTILTHRVVTTVVAVSFATLTVACAQSSPQKGVEAASEPTAAWTKAFNAGDSVALAALYAEDARSLPPGGMPVVGRSNIESYWRADMGEGGASTTLTPIHAVAQGDLVHVEGDYQVTGKGSDVKLAEGQYQQLWTRAGGQWHVQHEMWRIDPALHREVDVAEGLTSSWQKAYNAGDPKALIALYAEDAALSTVQDGTFSGKAAIESFWVGDLGVAKPSSTLTLTDVYIVGEMAHLEGDYKVTDSGKITEGRYIQMWMRDANGWRIHREMWWR